MPQTKHPEVLMPSNVAGESSWQLKYGQVPQIVGQDVFWGAKLAPVNSKGTR